LPVDDRVRLAAAFEARAADRRVDGVGGRLLTTVAPTTTFGGTGAGGSISMLSEHLISQ
jgi:hypothetical protein